LLSKTVGGFELLAILGEGGMGTVFKARQTGLDRPAALKILSSAMAQNEQYIARFQHEAHASAKLNHPHIVQGIDVGYDKAECVWYFAMEFIDGPSMRSVLHDTGAVPELKALEITRQVALALDCAHKAGMVHRDVKPDNILMTLQGEAKLADLGLARRVETSDSVTVESQAIGTPLYMSPEQARGEDREIDIRSDLYALGATLYHFVTGVPPFVGKTAAIVMTKHLTEQPPLAHVNAPGVSGATARLIQKMMAKQREERFQTPQELIAEIDRISHTLHDSNLRPPSRSMKHARTTSSVRVAEISPSGSRPKLAQVASTAPRTSTPQQRYVVRAPAKAEVPAELPPSVLATPAKIACVQHVPVIEFQEEIEGIPTDLPLACPDLTPPPPRPEPPPQPTAPPKPVVPRGRMRSSATTARRRIARGVLLDIVVLVVVVAILIGSVYVLRKKSVIGWPKFLEPEPSEQTQQ